MVRPTTGQPCCCKRAATVELCTPPLMAKAKMPDCVSARAGRISNWGDVIIRFYFTGFMAAALARLSFRSGLLGIGGGELAQLGDSGGDALQGEVNVFGGGVASQAEAQAGTRLFRREANRGEHVRRLDGARGAGRAGGTC